MRPFDALKNDFQQGNLQMAVSIFIFVITTAFLAIFSLKVPANGDTYAYAYSITNLIGGPYHRGYDAIGYLIYSALNPFGIEPLQILTAMSVVSGGAAVAEIFLLSIEFNPSTSRALLTAATLLFNGCFWLFAEHGEVYVPQLAFELAALLAVMRGYTLLSSLLFIVAVSITPTSCLLLPVLIYVLIEKKYMKNDILRFMLPLIVIFVAALTFKHREVWNTVCSSIYTPGIFFRELSLSGIASKISLDLLKVYGRGLNLFLIIGLWGAVIMCMKERKVFLFMLLILLPFLSYILNLGLLTGDHLMLTFVPASLFIACGLHHILLCLNDKIYLKITAVGILFTVYAVFSYLLFIAPAERDARELVRVIDQFNMIKDDHSVLIAEFTFGIAYWYMKHNEENPFILTGRPNDYLLRTCGSSNDCQDRLSGHYWINMTHVPSYLEIEEDFLKKAKGRTLYVADLRTHRTELIKLLLPDKYWKGSEGMGIIDRVSRYLSKKLGLTIRYEEIIQSPRHPVYRLEICDR